MWRLKKEIEGLILKVVKGRQGKSPGNGESEKDLLQILLESAGNSKHTIGNVERFIVDNCKNIYFAGHDTTAITASWTLMLLSLHPEWQKRVRGEIVAVCGDHSLDLDKLGQMKTLTMVIQESLRLYGPAITASREALEEMKLGDLVVPKGTNIWILIPAVHRDPEYWGGDADEFKPERFEGGVKGACKHPQAYLPFGLGSRLCVGQTFAMLQLKIVLSLILSNFSFALSPNYRHSPVYRMVLKPQYGIPLLVTRLRRT